MGPVLTTRELLPFGQVSRVNMLYLLLRRALCMLRTNSNSFDVADHVNVTLLRARFVRFPVWFPLAGGRRNAAVREPI